jgi:alpha-amylase
MLSKISLATSLAQASFYGHNFESLGDDCSNFNGNVGCKSGQDTRYPDDWSKRAF